MTRPVVVDAIAEAAAAAIEATPPAAQLELLPPTRFEEGDKQHQRVVASVRRDRAGRPEGARNIATREAVEFVRRVFGDPLIESARWAMHTPKSLAIELGCTKLEAFDRLEDIRKDLRRFMYAPLAAVDGQGNAVSPTLAVVIGGADGAVSVDGRPIPPWERAATEIKQIQPVTPTTPDVSQTDVSHGEVK